MFLIKQQGASFIELLIGIVVGLMILSGMVYFIARTTTNSTMNLKTVRLEYEIQSALDLMTHDIRRAGYWQNANSMVYSGVNTNPFMATGTTNIMLPNSSCLLFSYDFNKDGLLPALGATPYDERFGYRLSSGAIQTRAATDSSLSCASGNWEDLTDPSLITITNLTFTLTPTVIPLQTPATSEAIVVRYVTILIVGQLVDDASVTVTRSASIRVRNDEYQP